MNHSKHSLKYVALKSVVILTTLWPTLNANAQTVNICTRRIQTQSQGEVAVIVDNQNGSGNCSRVWTPSGDYDGRVSLYSSGQIETRLQSVSTSLENRMSPIENRTAALEETLALLSTQINELKAIIKKSNPEKNL